MLVPVVITVWEAYEYWKCDREYQNCVRVYKKVYCRGCDGVAMSICGYRMAFKCSQELECYWDILWKPVDEIKWRWVRRWRDR